MIIIPLLAAAFAAGALTLVVLAIHREDGGHLPHRAPTRATAAARHVLGLRVSGTKPAARGDLPTTPGGHADQDPPPAGGESPPFPGGQSR